MTDGLSAEQAQTEETFSFKWSKTDTYASPEVRNEWRRWLLEKYFDSEPEGPVNFLGSRPLRILDAGCGAGISALLLFWDALANHDYVGVDISDSVIEARRNFELAGVPGTFIQVSLTDLPDDLGNFDLIFSEGALHHTESVADSLAYPASRLRPGGRIAFYVYARRAPIREFTDDYVRAQIAPLSHEEAWNALMPLSALGKTLGDLGQSIEIPEDIEVLGIQKGTYEPQRLFFYKRCKAYYRPEYSLEEVDHINFDWFRPANCHRLTSEELVDAVEKAGLEIQKLIAQDSGLTVVETRIG